jgi:hypothetical protein
MLKWLQLASSNFLVAKQKIAHSWNSALNCQFPILSKLLSQLWRDQSVTTVNYVYVSFCSDINTRFLLTRDSLEGIAVRRLQRIWETQRTIIILHKVQYYLRSGIVSSYYKVSRTDYIKFRVSKLIRVEQFRMIIWTYRTNSKFIIIRVLYSAR